MGQAKTAKNSGYRSTTRSVETKLRIEVGIMLDSTGRTFQMDVHTLLLILLLFFVNSIEDEEVDFYTHVKRQ